MFNKLTNFAKKANRHYKFIAILLIGSLMITLLLHCTDHVITASNHQHVVDNTDLGFNFDERQLFIMSLKNETIYNQFPDLMSFRQDHALHVIIRDAFNAAFPLIEKWKKYMKTYCDDTLSVFEDLPFQAEDILLNSDLIKVNAKDEKYSFQPGAFRIACESILPSFPKVSYTFTKDSDKNYIKEWYQSINSSPQLTISPVREIEEGVYVIVRHKYNDLYWVISDMYDVFLHCLINGDYPHKVTVLLFDAHPKSPLDDLWKAVFGKVIRPYELPRVTLFKELTWTKSRTISLFQTA